MRDAEIFRQRVVEPLVHNEAEPPVAGDEGVAADDFAFDSVDKEIGNAHLHADTVDVLRYTVVSQMFLLKEYVACKKGPSTSAGGVIQRDDLLLQDLDIRERTSGHQRTDVLRREILSQEASCAAAVYAALVEVPGNVGPAVAIDFILRGKYPEREHFCNGRRVLLGERPLRDVRVEAEAGDTVVDERLEHLGLVPAEYKGVELLHEFLVMFVVLQHCFSEEYNSLELGRIKKEGSRGTVPS